MTDMSHSDFFEMCAAGRHESYIDLGPYSERVTVEELYQHFKARMIEELGLNLSDNP